MSYSRMVVAETCHRQYWWRYVLNHRGQPDNRYSLVGSTLAISTEEWLKSEVWLNDQKNAAQALRDTIKRVWVEQVKRPHTLTEAEQKMELGRALSMVENTIRGFVQCGALTRKMEVEKKKVLALGGGHTLYARPDVVAWKSKSRCRVIDGKTTVKTAYLDPAQLAIYAAAWQKEHPGVDIDTGFLMFQTGEYIPVDWRAEWPSTVDRIKAAIDVARRLQGLSVEAEATPTSKCMFCDFRHKCKEYQAQVKTQVKQPIVGTSLEGEMHGQ